MTTNWWVSCFHLQSPTSKSGSLRAPLGRRIWLQLIQNFILHIQITLPTVFVENVTIHRHYVLRPWLYFTLNILLPSSWVFHHNVDQILRLRVTFHFYPPSLSLTYALSDSPCQQVIFSCETVLSLHSHCHSGEFFVVLCTAGCWAAFLSSAH